MNHFNDEERAYALELYFKYEGRKSHAALDFKINLNRLVPSDAFTKAWKEEGYFLRESGGLQEEIPSNLVKKAFDICEGDFWRLMEKLNIHTPTRLIKLCQRDGIIPKKIPYGYNSKIKVNDRKICPRYAEKTGNGKKRSKILARD